MGLSWIVLGLCLGAATASAGSPDGSRPVLCAFQSVLECAPGAPCTPVTLESVSLPSFIRVDLAAKTIEPARPTDAKRRGEIKAVEKVGGRWILHGVDGGPEAERRSLGWTASISEETGKLVLSVAADDVGFVVFGACLPL